MVIIIRLVPMITIMRNSFVWAIFSSFTASVIQSALDYLFASVSVISLMWKFRPKYISTYYNVMNGLPCH